MKWKQVQVRFGLYMAEKCGIIGRKKDENAYTFHVIHGRRMQR